jgi:golgi phosphoprotein 3
MLTLYEEILLLSIHQDKGTFIGWSIDRINSGLTGAVLFELAMLEKIHANHSHRLEIVDADPTEDELLNETLSILKESEKERKFGYWIGSLNQKPDKLRKLVVERLIIKGVVVQEDDHLVWVIPSPLHPQGNASTKYWASQRLRGIVLAQEAFDKRDIALLSLLRACNLLDLIFLKDERRLASQRINEMAVNAAMKDPDLQTMEEIESALSSVVEDE